ncbi:MAG: addiction module antitoxin [marine bacterium B5-7]|nr:MAG: addiction module antitoxin [marine bacterium B5-7]
MKRSNKFPPSIDYEAWLVKSLRNKKEAVVFLETALESYQEDNNIEAFLLALRQVAQARGGIGKLSQNVDLNRQAIYQALSTKGNPRLNTLTSILSALGFRLAVKIA